MRTLYTYFRSSASYRVRIALTLKGLDWEAQAINLLERQQQSAAFLAVNPQGLVPVLVDDGAVLTQSPAIIEYLEESYPDPPLLPSGRVERAYVRSLCNLIACDIHPLNNVRVLRYLKQDLGVSEEAKDAWYAHWIATGFAAFEARLEREGLAGRYCLGDAIGMAEVFLVPQVFNARRYDCDLSPYPRLAEIADRAAENPAIKAAHPSGQADAA
jgi:maleylacetoacetate isomerase